MKKMIASLSVGLQTSNHLSMEAITFYASPVIFVDHYSHVIVEKLFNKRIKFTGKARFFILVVEFNPNLNNKKVVGDPFLLVACFCIPMAI